MIGAAAQALANSLKAEQLAERCLMPDVEDLWSVSGDVAMAVGQRAIQDGVAAVDDADALQARLDESRWRPEYPEMVEG